MSKGTRRHSKKPTEAQIKAGIDQFVRRMLQWTINLVRIENDQPRSAGSGFIYERSGRHTLFTVLHSFQPDDDNPDDISFDGWHIETGVIADGGVILVSLPPFSSSRRRPFPTLAYQTRGTLISSGDI